MKKLFFFLLLLFKTTFFLSTIFFLHFLIFIRVRLYILHCVSIQVLLTQSIVRLEYYIHSGIIPLDQLDTATSYGHILPFLFLNF